MVIGAAGSLAHGGFNNKHIASPNSMSKIFRPTELSGQNEPIAVERVSLAARDVDRLAKRIRYTY